MKDTCDCPNCQTKLDVVEYGYGLKCSECGCRVDVFPDTTLYLETIYGVVGIALPKQYEELLINKFMAA